MHYYCATMDFYGKFEVGIQTPDEATARQFTEDILTPSPLAHCGDVVSNMQPVEVDELPQGSRVKPREELIDDVMMLDSWGRRASEAATTKKNDDSRQGRVDKGITQNGCEQNFSAGQHAPYRPLHEI